MLGIGIIGAGDFGAAHARAIARLTEVRLVAACRTRAAPLAAFTEEFGGRGYTDYRRLLADPEVEAVVIATPHQLHAAMVEAAAAAGKHVLLEKPMAPTPAECRRIRQCVARSGISLMVGHTSHFVPAYRVARELLDAGELGEVFHGCSTMTRPWMTPNRRDWHLRRDSGGGMWLTIGVHVLDQLIWLLGGPVKSVAAELQTRFHDQQADDFAVALLRFQSGATATASCIGYRSGVFTFRTQLTGSRGLMRIDHTRGVFIGRDERWRAVPGSASTDWMADALLAEWRAFAAALRTGSAMPVGDAYAAHVMAVAFAAEESSRRQREQVLS